MKTFEEEFGVSRFSSLSRTDQFEIYRIHSIMELPNAVFVFGSNEAGIHGAGAAKVAAEKYGAIKGMGRGFASSYRSYAIPTKDYDLKVRTLIEIEHDVREFLEIVIAGNESWAEEDLIFAVTRIGCGYAGYKDEDIAPMFANAPVNCLLPIGWRDYK